MDHPFGKPEDFDWSQPRVTTMEWQIGMDRIFHRSDKGNIIKRYHRKRPRQGRWAKQRRRGMHRAIREGRVAWDAHFGMWLYRTEMVTGTIGGKDRRSEVMRLQGEINALRTADREHKEVRYSSILLTNMDEP